MNAIEIQSLKKTYDTGVEALKGIDLVIPEGSFFGLLGPNGAGKTTLFRMIMGEETPDDGSFKVGSTVKLGYVDQSHEDLDPEKSIFEVISSVTP